MKLNRLYLIVILSLLVIHSGHAQIEDYIITLTNDTLKGEISEQKDASITFKSYKDQELHIFTAKQIKGYSIDQSEVIVANLNIEGFEQAYFIKKYIEGYVSLYELTKIRENILYIIRLPDGKYQPLPQNNSSWGILRGNLLECKSNLFENEIHQRNYTYSFPFFIRIIKIYNQCLKPQSRIYQPKKPKNSLTYGISAGIFQNNWNYTFDTGNNVYFNLNGDLSEQYRVVLGTFFSFGLSHKISCLLEPIYNQYEGSRTVPIANAGVNYGNYQIFVKEKLITLPIMFRYSLYQQNSYKILAKGGPSIGYDLSYQESKQRTGGGLEIIPRKNTINFGYGFGVEFEKKISTKLVFRADLKYLKRYVQAAVTQVGIGNSLQLGIGLGFYQ